MTYKLIKDMNGKEDQVLKRTNPDGTLSFIPFVAENTDYQEYLEWVAEGNTAEAAD